MTINEMYQEKRKNGKFEPQVKNNFESDEEPVTPTSKGHKGWVVVLVLLVAILGIAAITCPKKIEHQKVMVPILSQFVDEKVDEIMASLPKMSKKEMQNMQWVIEAAKSAGLQGQMEENVYVSNHIFYSTGYLMTTEGPVLLSIGVFGHVFEVYY